MRDKTIYTKNIAISEKDLAYIKKLRDSGRFKRMSLAGICSLIIRKHVSSERKNFTKDANKPNVPKNDNLKSETIEVKAFNSEKANPGVCKHNNYNKVCSADFTVLVCKDCGEEIKQKEVGQDERSYSYRLNLGDSWLTIKHKELYYNMIY